MSYTPIGQLEKPTKGYIPIGSEIPKKETPVSLDLGTDIFGTQTSTLATLPQEYKTIQQVAGEFTKEVGQSIARNVASAGLTIAGAVAPRELKPFVGSLKEDDFKSFLAKGTFETIFGKGEEVKTIEQRIAEAEPKVEEFKKELEIVSKSPDLTPTERLITTILANLDTPSITFLGIMGSTGIDLTPFGGLEKNVFKSMIKAKTAGKAIEVLTKMGVADDLARQFAEDVVKVTDDKAAKKLFEHIANVQQTTKAAPKTAPKLQPLAQEAPKALAPVKPISTRIAGVRYKDLDEIAEAIKRQDISREQLDEARMSLVFFEDSLQDMPGKQLAKFISRKEGQFLDPKSPSFAKTTRARQVLIEKERKILNVSQGAFEGTSLSDRFDDPDVIREAIEDYTKRKERIEKLKGDIRVLRQQKSLTRKGEELIRLAQKDRRVAFRALKGRYNLNDADLERIRGGKNLSIMTKDQFKSFMAKAENVADDIEAHRAAEIQLQATIFHKELQKWENVRDALKFPKSLDEMSIEQLTKLEEVLAQYKTGDEFLPVRMMETLSNTRLKDARTTREILEVLAKEKGLTVEEVSKIQPSEFHRFMGDHMLAREHPFFENLVLVKNKSFLEANARIIELSDKADELIKVARGSRPRGLAERLVPTDENIVKWLESDSVVRTGLAKEMTSEELRAARFMDSTFREYYDYLVLKHSEKKFSRFEDKYFPHVRRNFFEAWKEDGILKAFREMWDKYAQDEKYLNILNERTNEILPYEKWVGFTQFRTDKLIPTSNAAKAFESYVTTLEKAKHLDAIVPEIMAYVHVLSPRRMSERGIELDTSLKRFVKEWVNANKGRTPKGFFVPGGKMDWALRSSVALTRFLDLGLNFTTQIASPIGEQVMNLTMLKPVAYKTALVRRGTAQGRMIINKYENFVGRGFFKELSRASNNASDNLMSSIFAIFHGAIVKGNEIFLLGKLTEEEFKAGVVSTERLAKLLVEMNKYRAVKGTESIMGRTGEAIAFKQYKSWAIPIVRATATNALDLAKMIRKEGVFKAINSDAGKELFYSVGIGSAIGIGVYAYFTELQEKGGKRTFMEDMAYKAMRDSMSMLGALDPTLWSGIRVADFYEDLSKTLYDLITLDTLKTTGEFKGVKGLERLFTPRAVSQFLPKDEQKQSPAGKLKSPKLLEAGSSKLPAPRGLK